MKSFISTQAVILEALSRGENYGIGIIEWAAKTTQGEIQLMDGALYPKLDDLVIKELIEHTRTEISSANNGGNPREYYKLTETGNLQAETNRRIIASLFHLAMPEEPITTFSEKEAIILELLCQKSMYGLEIVDKSNGQISRGTVYVTIDRMIRNKGYVEIDKRGKNETGIGPDLVYYKPTKIGELKFKRWKTLFFTPKVNE